MPRLPILCYHNVGQCHELSRFKLLYVDPTKFERQLQIIHRLGFRGVSIGDGLRHLNAGKCDRLIALTFDDGYADTLDRALPSLLKFGFTATCYLVHDCIGKYNHWDAEYLQERKSLMGQRQIECWLAGGMEIGSHSLSHPRLQGLSDDDAWREIMESRASLAALFGVRVDHFSYPYGGFTPGTVEMVKRAGYLSAVSMRPGIAVASDDRYRLPRIFVDGGQGWCKFLLKLLTPYQALRRRFAVG